MSDGPGLINWLLLAILGFIWGTSFLGVSVALEGFGPFTIAAARIAIGAMLLTAVAFASGHGLPGRATATDRRVWLHCLGFALFTNAIPFTLLGWGQLRVPSGFAGISMAVVPLFVLPLAFFILREPLTVRRLAGFLLGFCGVVILIGPGALLSGDNDLVFWAKLACVGASLCYATGSMVTRTAPPVPLQSYSAAGLIISSCMIVPLALWVEGVPRVEWGVPLLAVLYLGVFPTAIATVMLVRVINSAGPTFMSLVNYQVPIWAVINGMLILDEDLPPSFLTALVLILSGLALSQARGVRFRA